MNNKIVFFSKMAQGVPTLAPVQEKTDGVFVSNRSETLLFFKNNYPKLPYFKYIKYPIPFIPARKILSEANIIVSGARHNNILGKYKAKKVMIFHGTYRSLSMERLEDLNHFDHVILNGPRMKKQLLRFKEKIKFAYTVTGYIPFFNFPKKTIETRLSILKRIKLSSQKKTIVYLPARRDCGSWTEHGLKLAREINAKYNLILRPHPNQTLHGNKKEQKYLKEILTTIKEKNNIILDMSKASFPELMCIADVIISDATSPTEESMLYNVPQIITETYPRENWENSYKKENMHKDDIAELMSLYDCALSFKKSNFKNWNDAIKITIQNSEQYSSAREKYFKNAFGNYLDAVKLSAELIKKL